MHYNPSSTYKILLAEILTHGITGSKLESKKKRRFLNKLFLIIALCKICNYCKMFFELFQELLVSVLIYPLKNQ